MKSPSRVTPWLVVVAGCQLGASLGLLAEMSTHGVFMCHNMKAGLGEGVTQSKCSEREELIWD